MKAKLPQAETDTACHATHYISAMFDSTNGQGGADLCVPKGRLLRFRSRARALPANFAQRVRQRQRPIPLPFVLHRPGPSDRFVLMDRDQIVPIPRPRARVAHR